MWLFCLIPTYLVSQTVLPIVSDLRILSGKACNASNVILKVSKQTVSRDKKATFRILTSLRSRWDERQNLVWMLVCIGVSNRRTVGLLFFKIKQDSHQLGSFSSIFAPVKHVCHCFCLHRFHRELTAGASPDWTVTTVWHWHWKLAEWFDCWIYLFWRTTFKAGRRLKVFPFGSHESGTWGAGAVQTPENLRTLRTVCRWTHCAAWMILWCLWRSSPVIFPQNKGFNAQWWSHWGKTFKPSLLRLQVHAPPSAGALQLAWKRSHMPVDVMWTITACNLVN